jgi:hypothetical protein
MDLFGLALGVLAVAILGFGAALLIARRVMKRRIASIVGPYLVRVGPAKGRGREGTDLEHEFDTLADAQEAARSALLTWPDDDVSAFVLGCRADDEWDVVDRVDVLTPS